MNVAYAFFSRKDVEAQNKLIQQLKKDIEETGRKKKVSSVFSENSGKSTIVLWITARE